MARGLITYGNRHWQLGDNTDHLRNPLDISVLLKFLHSYMYNVKQAGAGCTRKRTNQAHMRQLQGPNKFGSIYMNTCTCNMQPVCI